MAKKNCNNPEIKDIIARAKSIQTSNEKRKHLEEENTSNESSQDQIPKDDKEEEEKSDQGNTGLTPFINNKGIMIHEDGRMSKTKYLQNLKISESQYNDLQLTEEEAARISNTMKHLSTGINASIPIACTGPSCPFARNCPYEKEGKAPIGKDCAVEVQLINYWTEQFIEEFDVDPESLTEIHMVSELAEFNIYEMRVTKYLAENNMDLMQDVTVGFDHSGEVIENTDIAKAFDLKERIKRGRIKVLEALSATRKDKLKLISKQVKSTSVANTLSDIKRKMDDFKKDIENMDAIDAEVVKEES